MNRNSRLHGRYKKKRLPMPEFFYPPDSEIMSSEEEERYESPVEEDFVLEEEDIREEDKALPDLNELYRYKPCLLVSLSEHSITMVTFVIGAEPDPKTFYVHKHLACAHSPFFEAAFQGQMIEGRTQSMRFEDVEIEIFGDLVHWMYTNTLQNDFLSRDSELTEVGKLAYIGLWKLAERCLMPVLQNTVMIAMLGNGSWFMNDKIVELAHFACQNPGNTALKRFVVYKLAWDWTAEMYSQMIEQLPTELIGKVSETLKRHVESRNEVAKIPGVEFFVEVDTVVRMGK
ncbi:hypothetical protein VTL71DRAFT_4507 [Oculimacula yallundae]|uniref:BTB domain-containing protein n=1 Tax=Oculimacula yallundae TaxID=86028 RepID=A0ABR4C4K7_9HELO